MRNFADFDYVVSPSGRCVHHIGNKFTAADDTPERRHVSTHVWDLLEFPRDVLEVDSFRGPGLTTRSPSTFCNELPQLTAAPIRRSSVQVPISGDARWRIAVQALGRRRVCRA